jgi:hypothetical protein
MVGIPNLVNGTLLREMCVANSLSDPYLTVYPNKKDYTYTPFGDLSKNRSRLDFFIISENLIPFIGHCSISPSVLCSQFDHKNVNTINSNFLFKKKSQS